MSKIRQTRQQRLNTLHALNVMWPRIPERLVVTELAEWVDWDVGGDPIPPLDAEPSCGSPACFGGWCARDSYYANQGLKRDEVGVPCLVTPRGDARYSNVSANLFGDRRLFDVAGDHPADYATRANSLDRIVSEHALVTARLQWLLDNSEVTA